MKKSIFFGILATLIAVCTIPVNAAEQLSAANSVQSLIQGKELIWERSGGGYMTVRFQKDGYAEGTFNLLSDPNSSPDREFEGRWWFKGANLCWEFRSESCYAVKVKSAKTVDLTRIGDKRVFKATIRD